MTSTTPNVSAAAAQTLAVIEQHPEGIAPAEIAKARGRTTRAIYYHLTELRTAGIVSHEWPTDPATGRLLPPIVTVRTRTTAA